MFQLFMMVPGQNMEKNKNEKINLNYFNNNCILFNYSGSNNCKNNDWNAFPKKIQ